MNLVSLNQVNMNNSFNKNLLHKNSFSMINDHNSHNINLKDDISSSTTSVKVII
jgi:hypothetical protein